MTPLMSDPDQDKYEIEHLIAEGGMGKVYYAKDKVIKRHIALKTLSKDKQNASFKGRFVNEALITGQLEHPNIVPLYELDQSGENLHYTMKFIKGVTLKSILALIAKGNAQIIKKYPLPELLSIFDKICDGIAYAHAKGIIHRDLKPDNVMVGNYGEVIIIDWGIAKFIDKPSEYFDVAEKESNYIDIIDNDETRTLSGQLIGSPHFMPPEQAKGHVEELDRRTDIFALGAILYNILTLHRPFEGKNVTECLAKIVEGDFRDPMSYNIREPSRKPLNGKNIENLPHLPGNKIPKVLSLIIQKAMAYEKHARYQRVKSLQTDLDAWSNGHLTSVEDHNLSRKISLFYQRHRTPVNMSLLFVQMMLLIAIAFYHSHRQHETNLMQVRSQKEAIEAKNLQDQKKTWTLIFSDDFSDPDIDSRWDFFGSKNSKWRYDRGKLHVLAGEPLLIMPKKRIVDNIRIRFECTVVSDYLNDISCFMHHDASRRTLSDNNGYLFQFGGYDNNLISLFKSTFSLNEGRSKNSYLYKEYASPVKKGERFQMQAEYDHGRLRYFANGKLLFEIKDDDPLVGLNMNRVGIYHYQTEAFYDNIEVYQKGFPLKMDILDVAYEMILTGQYETASSLIDKAQSSDLDEERIRRAGKLKVLCDIPKYQRLLKSWGIEGGLELLKQSKIKFTLTSTGHERLPDDFYRLPISDLVINAKNVKQLSGLHHMPLSSLELNNYGSHQQPFDISSVADFSKLTGLRTLHLGNCHLLDSEFAFLKNLYLKKLSLNVCNITTLKHLRGHPLKHLSLMSTSIKDLEPLRGMPMETLVLWGTKVKDISALAGMKLTNLDLSATIVENAEALRNMPLKSLNLRSARVLDYAFLKDMPVEKLITSEIGPRTNLDTIKTCDRLRDLTLKILDPSELEDIAGLNLFQINIVASPLKDFTRLKSCSNLTRINLDYSFIDDLSIFKDFKKLNHLSLVKCPNVKNLDPLLDCKSLKQIRVPERDTDLSQLKKIPSLRSISYKNIVLWKK